MGDRVSLILNLTTPEPAIKNGIRVHPGVADRLDDWVATGRERSFLIPAETYPDKVKVTIRVQRSSVVSIIRAYDE